MDVQVTLNGSDITQHVIKYDREHKICSGIGMLEMEVSYEYSGSIDPWDEIIIYENGRRNGQYFVSSTDEGEPNSSIQIVAQDNSKRLSDYFISDAYLIDYPSYASFWIGYFLDEVGISYNIVSPDPGTLLSNNTALGLMSAYEQIMYLLQLNGWYMTFNYSGTVIIGKLTADYGSNRTSLGNRDILEIRTIKSDSMLRNRVVVWGKGDPERGHWIFADVYKPTKWDYDKKDRRTIVIANGNIRKMRDAFWLANKALLEFSTLTVEKHMTLKGARNLLVGDVVTVRNTTFSGKGKITTFGTSMSKEGLVTNLSLDERCPRLFAFWDLGGFVYVSTFGSGVWRKHILPAWSGSPTGSGLIGFASGIFNVSGWYDYSMGLSGYDMNVTDLHVNAGVLMCVTASGRAYYSIEDEHPWSGISFSGFTVSVSGELVVMSNGLVDTTVYSGVMSRACIIDRDTNYMRVAVDTRSGENLGDFLMETDPFSDEFINSFFYITPSGTISPTSGIFTKPLRSWVVDANPYSGLVMDTFPIGISGNYNFWAYDIENDGFHDYLSVMSPGSGDLPSSAGTGRHASNYRARGSSFSTENNTVMYGFRDLDGDLHNFMPYSGLLFPQSQTVSATALSTTSLDEFEGLCYLEDYYPIGHVVMGGFSILSGDRTIKGTRIVRNINNSLTTTRRTYNTGLDENSSQPIAVFKKSENQLRYCFIQSGNLVCIDLDIVLNTTTTTTFTDVLASTIGSDTYDVANIVIEKQLIQGFSERYTEGTGGMRIKIRTVDLLSGGFSTITVADLADGPGVEVEPGLFIPSHSFYDCVPLLAPYKEGYVFNAFVAMNIPVDYPDYSYKIWRVFKKFNGGTLASIILDYSALYGSWHATAPLDFLKPGVVETANDLSSIFSTKFITPHPAPPEIDIHCDTNLNTWYSQLPDTNDIVRPYATLNKTYDLGIAETSPISFINPASWSHVSDVVEPDGYDLINYAGKDSFNGEYYFSAWSGSHSGANKRMLAMDPDTGRISRVTTWAEPAASFEICRGNFRITNQNVWWCRPPNIPMMFPVYFVLQRDNYDYNIVKSGLYRDRLDISNYSPLVTMDRRISSTELYYISTDNSVTVVSNPSISGGGYTGSGSIFALGVLAEDYRYTSQDGQIESGYGSNIFVAFSGSVGKIDMATLESISGVFTSSSGYVIRLETSNFSLPDQYMFVTLSGTTGSGLTGTLLEGVTLGLANTISQPLYRFVQKDPVSGVWVDYSSGYPQSRTTMIRLDDMI